MHTLAVFACHIHVYIDVMGVKGESVVTPQYELTVLSYFCVQMLKTWILISKKKELSLRKKIEACEKQKRI